MEFIAIIPTPDKEVNASFWGKFENTFSTVRSSKDKTEENPYSDHMHLIEKIRTERRKIEKAKAKFEAVKEEFPKGSEEFKTAKAKFEATKKSSVSKIKDARAIFTTVNRQAFGFLAGGMTEVIIQKHGDSFRVTVARPENRNSHAFESKTENVDETINSYRVAVNGDLLKWANSKNAEKKFGLDIADLNA